MLSRLAVMTIIGALSGCAQWTPVDTDDMAVDMAKEKPDGCAMGMDMAPGKCGSINIPYNAKSLICIVPQQGIVRNDMPNNSNCQWTTDGQKIMASITAASPAAKCSFFVAKATGCATTTLTLAHEVSDEKEQSLNIARKIDGNALLFFKGSSASQMKTPEISSITTTTPGIDPDWIIRYEKNGSVLGSGWQITAIASYCTD